MSDQARQVAELLARGDLPRSPRLSVCPECLTPVPMREAHGRLIPGGTCVACVEKARLGRVREVLMRIPDDVRGLRFTSALVLTKAGGVAIAAAQAALRDDATVILLCGRTGRGKTVLAGAIAHAVIDAAVPGCSQAAIDRAAGVRWVSAIALGKSEDESRLGKTPELLAAAEEAPFLVLDELGHEAKTEPVWRVIYERHARRRLTVITTALSPRPKRAGEASEIATRYDGGGARRLLEPPHAVVIDVGARS